MKEVVSVSLGSSKRDHVAEAELLGQRFKIRRIGTDGSFSLAIDKLRELDGQVDAIGLGGIDLYLYAGGKRYAIRDAAKLARAVTKTPVVDGSGLKDTLERETIRYVREEAKLPLDGKKVLMVSAVDRFGMAEALVAAGCPMTFGDLIFGLKIPIALHSFRFFTGLAKAILPVVTKMPFTMLYPTGEKQESQRENKNARYYRDADVIAGDYLFIKRYMPPDMLGKWIITNTVTAEDVDEIKKRGVEFLITTTPEFGGRSFGTNVMEALFVAVLGRSLDDISGNDYLDLIKQLDFKPRIERLN